MNYVSTRIPMKKPGAPCLALLETWARRAQGALLAKAFCRFHPLIGNGLLPIFEQPHTKSTDDED
jgi:hypothetical protein